MGDCPSAKGQNPYENCSDGNLLVASLAQLGMVQSNIFDVKTRRFMDIKPVEIASDINVAQFLPVSSSGSPSELFFGHEHFHVAQDATRAEPKII
jgi:hypothetical protein